MKNLKRSLWLIEFSALFLELYGYSNLAIFINVIILVLSSQEEL